MRNLATLAISAEYERLSYWVEIIGPRDYKGWTQVDTVSSALDEADGFLIQQGYSREGRPWEFNRHRDQFEADVVPINPEELYGGE